MSTTEKELECSIFEELVFHNGRWSELKKFETEGVTKFGQQEFERIFSAAVSIATTCGLEHIEEDPDAPITAEQLKKLNGGVMPPVLIIT